MLSGKWAAGRPCSSRALLPADRELLGVPPSSSHRPKAIAWSFDAASREAYRIHGVDGWSLLVRKRKKLRNYGMNAHRAVTRSFFSSGVEGEDAVRQPTSAAPRAGRNDRAGARETSPCEKRPGFAKQTSRADATASVLYCSLQVRRPTLMLHPRPSLAEKLGIRPDTVHRQPTVKRIARRELPKNGDRPTALPIRRSAA